MVCLYRRKTMDKVKKSYSLAKTKNISRFDSLLADEKVSTILFVSKYGSIKQGFLRDYINDSIKDETIVMNFMYFNELYSGGKEYDIETHFEQQLFMHKDIEVEELEETVTEEVTDEDKSGDFFSGILFLIDAAIVALVTYFVITKINIGEYIEFMEGKEKFLAYALYAIAAVLVGLGVIAIAKALAPKKSNGTEKKPVRKKVRDLAPSEVEELSTSSFSQITEREKNTKDLFQTQSLDFSAMLKGNKNNYEFDLSITSKKYFVLYGLDEHINFIKTNAESPKEAIKQVSDFMIKIYSTFKKYNDRKLIFVWKDKVFINQDLTLLIFDEIFTLYGDFDEIEVKNHILSTFELNGYVVSSDIREEIATRIDYLSDIDEIVEAMNNIEEGARANVSDDQLAYIHFLNKFEKEKVEQLKKYFQANSEVVSVKDFTISEQELDICLGIGSPAPEHTAEVVETEEKHLDYPDVMIDSSIDNIDYKVTDDYDSLVSFMESVPEKDLSYFINLDILSFLFNSSDEHILLGEKIVFALLNLEEDDFAPTFKSLFNHIVKRTTKDKDACNAEYKIIERLLMIMIAIERRKRLACMYFSPTNYIKNNRQLAVMMIRHINGRIGDYEVFSKNESLINCLIDEAVADKA